ncbi:MAG: HD family hydrolase [Pseudomonadota bacterium]
MAARAWQRMLSGRRLNLLHPSPLDIEISDIAHGLSRVARWNGQTQGAYAFSVAQHSLVVARLVMLWQPEIDVKWRLAALLHDAPEYVIGDMISPFKHAIGPDYRSIEQDLLEAVHLRFGLPPELPTAIKKLIKKADKTSAFSEAVDLAGFQEAEARKILRYSRSERTDTLIALSPDDAKAEFLSEFQTLGAAA